MTVISFLTSSTIGMILLAALVLLFLGIFIFDWKHNGFWKALLKVFVYFVVLIAIYIAVYYALIKTNSPFVLIPLF